jgi:hypothetical protein
VENYIVCGLVTDCKSGGTFTAGAGWTRLHTDLLRAASNSTASMSSRPSSAWSPPSTTRAGTRRARGVWKGLGDTCWGIGTASHT